VGQKWDEERRLERLESNWVYASLFEADEKLVVSACGYARVASVLVL